MSIKDWRLSKKLTQQEAAKLFGCSASQLSEVETGKANFSTTKIKRILANVPDLTSDHFFTS